MANPSNRSTTTACVLFLVLAIFLQTPGQEPQAPPDRSRDSDVVRITTNLVQIDAIVTDKNDKQVIDLQPREFEVLEDGRPQRVTNLAYIVTQPSIGSGEGTPGSESSKRNAPPTPAANLRPEQVVRAIAIVVDDLGLSFVSTAFLRKALTRFVDEQIQPGDLVAIIRTSAGAGALQQFTTDRRQLHAAIDQVRWVPLGHSSTSVFAPLERDLVQGTANARTDTTSGQQLASDAQRLNDVGEAGAVELGQLREEAFTVGTLGAVSYVVRGMSQLPGRKSVVLFSDGFQLLTNLLTARFGDASSQDSSNRIQETNTPAANTRILEALQRLTDAANRASVVIYTVDTRGLQSLTLTAADNTVGLSTDQLENRLLDRRHQFINSQAGLSYLARLTGGLAIQNENDLNQGIRQILYDQSGYYLIGYRPDEATFDKNGRRTFHKITVKVKRPELRVRSRSGFFGVADDEARRRPNGESLAEALASPFGASAIHLRLTSLFGDDESAGPIMSSMLYIDANDLTFAEEADGWRKAEVEVQAFTFGAAGDVIDSLDRTHTIRARGDAYDTIRRDGLLYTVNVPIRKPGAYQLRIGIRDLGSKHLGSASQFIAVPDLKKDRLALSGIFVSGIDLSPRNAKAAATAPATILDDSLASPAVRQLRPGMEMHYAYYIYNAHLNGDRQPQLTTQIRLFHDGHQVYEGKATPYDAGSEPDLKRLRAGGRIKLSAAAAPGEYFLQVTVTDLLARDTRNTASQWIDFEIGN
jgi:VWFA-related protein